MNELTRTENIFYKDQRTSRECRISEDIDYDYKIEQERMQLNKSIEREREQLEEDFIMGDDDDNAGMDSTQYGMLISITKV